VSYRLKLVIFVLATALLSALPLAAQLRIGEYTRLSGNGDIAFGYAGGYSDAGSAGHGWDIGGNGNFSGYYYDPNFLSFNFRPYYGRSQANSAYQSIGDSSGFDFSVGIFGGSHFPGSISYGRSFNSTGTFGIPGVTGLVSHGDSRGFGIGWGVLLPGLPPVSVSYSDEASSSSIYGTNQTNGNWLRTLTVGSSYRLGGFPIQGSYMRLWNGSSTPPVLTGLTEDFGGASSSYQASTSHPLPWNGGMGFSFSRSSSSSDYHVTDLSQGYDQRSNTTTSTDNFNTQMSMHPFRKLSFSANASYTDNLFGDIFQDILNAGGAPPASLVSSKSRGLLVSGTAYYNVFSNFGVQGGVSHQQQYFEGQSYGSTQFFAGTSANYMRPLFGAFSFYVGMNDTASQVGNNGLGLNTSVNFARKIHGWEVGANFSYGQYVQTLLAVSTSSSYGFGGHIARKVNHHAFWNASFGASRSGFGHSGSSNHSEYMATSFSYHRYTVSATYNQSSGYFIITANGLSPTPPGVPPGVLPPEALSLFSSRAFSTSASATLLRRLVVSGAYTRGMGHSITPTLAVGNENRMLTGLMRYRLRRIYLTGGFTRFSQGITSVGTPGVVTSYNFGISRWFNLF